MKKEEAEKLVCPFMSHTTYNCITTECMAWKIDALHDKMEAYKNYSGELPIVEALDICYEDGYCMRLER